MIRRNQIPSLFVLSSALVVGVALFVVVGRMAGLLYGGAALTLGLILHQRLAGARPAEVAVDRPRAEPRERRIHLPQLPRGRRAELEAELARAGAELADREAAGADLERRLEEQHERLRELQSSFAERVAELTSERETHQSQLSKARTVLRAREKLVAQLTQERDELASERDHHRSQAAEFATQIGQLRTSHEAERTQLAWSWRAHVEELAALESAIDAVMHAPAGAFAEDRVNGGLGL